MDATDTKAIKGWEQIKKAAPNVWEKAKLVLNSVIADGVKKYLSL
jgi:hypothetical protein